MLISILAQQKKKLFCAFIDFEKAFDTVWRSGLWYKLIESNIRGKCFRVIYNLYQNIKSCVASNTDISSFFICSVGVRQGDNLSPFLFAIYLNDLEHFLRSKGTQGIVCQSDNDDTGYSVYFKLFVLLYADDTALLADSADALQNSLNQFQTYCDRWKLRVNIKKTKIVIFGKGRQPNHPHFYFDNSTVEVVKDFKYLGVIFSRSGLMHQSIKHNSEQANKALTLLLRNINDLNLHVDLQIELFNTMIKPILLYSCEIWGYSDITLIERVQTRFLKSIFNMKKSTPNYMVYGEFGVYPISVDIKTRMVSFWTKLLGEDLSKISTLIYHHARNTDTGNTNQWLNYTKTILTQCGLSGFWDSQTVGNPIWLTKPVNQKLKDLFINEWYSGLENTSSSHAYTLFKHKFELENYLLKLPHTLRKHLCLFRTRNHRLPVERGRWLNITTSDRKCHFCNSDVGDEFHALLKCPFFSIDRRRFIKPYFYKRPNIIKFDELMNTNNTAALKKLAKFVRVIMKATNEPN